MRARVGGIMRAALVGAAALGAALLGAGPLSIPAARAAEFAKVTIVVFTPPSLGGVLPTVIKQQKYVLANGIDFNFVERPPDAYIAGTVSTPASSRCWRQQPRC